jgi:RHS repeat-associated protein
MKRGTLTGSPATGISGTPVRELDWTLDPTGNWPAYITKTSGTTDLNQSRTASTVNEITAIAGTPDWADPVYDAAGNTTAFPKSTDPTQNFAAIYDAWNRMIEVDDGSSPIAKYQYDGSNRRIVKLTYFSGTLSETRHFHFTNDWQDIEERVEVSGLAVLDQQYVWGIRYVDELVCRDRPTGGSNERLYAMQDANFSLTSICDVSGAVMERYVFDPYGGRSIRNSSWGAMSSSAYAWMVGHQGLAHDYPVGLIYNRYRWLHVGIGRFVTRDAFGYIDGHNIYCYIRCNPGVHLDPSGNLCNIALRCGDAASGLGSHCGVIVISGAGASQIDGSGGIVNTFITVTGQGTWGTVGAFVSFAASVCSCLTTQITRWNALKVPRDHTNHNSNWSLSCLLTACGVTGLKVPEDMSGPPIGFSDCVECDPTKELVFTVTDAGCSTDCPQRKCVCP